MKPIHVQKDTGQKDTGHGLSMQPDRRKTSFLGKLARKAREFPLDNRGSLYALAAFISLPMGAFVGVGADAGRAYLVKSRLVQTLDAAGLAGAKVAHLSTYGDDIVRYFKANFPNNYLGATITGPTYQTDAAGETVTVTASAMVPTSFMHLFGHDSMQVSAETQVTRKQVHLDVVISMDMSGSMGSWSGGQQKIASARSAASTLVNILYGNSESKALLKMGLVPWNGRVNISVGGKTYDPNHSGTNKKFVNAYPNPVTGTFQNFVWRINNSNIHLLNADKPPAGWKGCVYARFKNDGSEGTNADATDGRKKTSAAHWIGWEWAGNSGTTCLSHGITKLNQSKTTILSAINALQNPAGVTNISQGLSWAWRVLTPKWPFKEAEANPIGQRVQAVVLLTDGAHVGGTNDAYKTTFGSGGGYHPRSDYDARLLKVAAAMKAQGIIVYVIQFHYTDPALVNLLKQVASGTGAPYYHFAPDSTALQAAFQQVGSALSQLRISQ